MQIDKLKELNLEIEKRREDLIDFFHHYEKEINSNNKAIYVNFTTFYTYFYDLSELLMNIPVVTLTKLSQFAEYWSTDKTKHIKIVFTDLMTEKLNISDLKNENVSKLIKVIGFVRFISDIYAVITISTYKCKDCNRIYDSEPERCKCGCLKLLREDVTEDRVMMLIEEEQTDKPPRSKYALLPQHLIYRLNEINIGSRITLDVIPYIQEKKNKTGIYQLDIYNFHIIKDGIDSISLMDKERIEITFEVQDPHFLNNVYQSIFKDIYGLEEIKKAILLQMVSSPKEWNGKYLRNRGNLMILLVGSPGVSKSVILKRVSSFFPRSRYASCSTATGIGLIASTRKEESTGSYVVEAGSIPLCHQNGICCIDECDKIDKEEIGHLNTMLDSLSIVIDKANIHTTLRADVSVLAALNPKFKIFDTTDEFYKQINLPNDFLDRFDLIFCLDSINSQDVQDKIADVVLSPLVLIETKYSDEFVLKYIAYARSYHPVMTPEAKVFIKDNYNGLTRLTVKEEGIRFSTRLLTNLIRLSGACARARLSNLIEIKDCQEAYNLLIFCLKSLGLVREYAGQMVIDMSKTGIIEKSKREKMRCILLEIRNHGKKLVELTTLQEKLNLADFDELIDKMKQCGEIYEPRRGFIQLL